MDKTALVDDYGRRTVFTGEQLVDDHTDTSEGLKPQWLEVGVWRTEGGNYVVQRTTCYRVRHSSPSCPRAEGYALVEAGDDDTYLCRACGASGPGYAQANRIVVEAYRTPQELIDSFQMEGRYSNLARAILADLSAVDPAVDAVWNTVVVP